MKVVIIGGHFTPALAVIEALPKGTEIIYIGRKYTFEKDTAVSLEYQTIQKLGIPFISLTTGRLQRSFTLQTIPSLLKIPYGFFQALAILKKYKPDCIVGFGGYLSVPVCLAGKVLNMPIVIHEQTLESGLANKIIGQFATKVCISWELSQSFFPKEKTVVTGNPIQLAINTVQLTIKTQKHKDIPLICIIGGSSGSHSINVLIEGCLRQLLEQYAVLHQTGDAQEFHDYDRLEKFKKTLPQKLQERYTISKFIPAEEFISVINQADLIVSRSGINTITALAYLKKMSLLIPLPFSQRNEQYKNAQLLQKKGLAEIAEQETLTSKKLFDKIAFMLNNRKKYQYVRKEKEETNDSISAAEKIAAVINDIYKAQTKKKDKKSS